jgi:hypothetical protein
MALPTSPHGFPTHSSTVTIYLQKNKLTLLIPFECKTITGNAIENDIIVYKIYSSNQVFKAA